MNERRGSPDFRPPSSRHQQQPPSRSPHQSAAARPSRPPQPVAAAPGQPPRPPVSRSGRLPRWVRQVPYVCVLCGVAIGLAVVAIGHFKKGSLLVGAAVLFGALARLVLPAGQVGLLATRKRAIDVLILVGFALAITAVAYAVQP